MVHLYAMTSMLRSRPCYRMTRDCDITDVARVLLSYVYEGVKAVAQAEAHEQGLETHFAAEQYDRPHGRGPPHIAHHISPATHQVMLLSCFYDLFEH